jgi:hypothetical protein
MASGYVNAGNLGIPIATYALGNAAEVAPVMLFQLTVLAPLFTTVLDLTSARADGQRPPLWRTLTAPVRNPIALASAADLTVSATGLRPPDPVLARVELIGNLAVPAMLLAFGLSLRGAPRPGAADSGPSLLAVLLLKRARGGAEFVAEQDAQLLVGRERLRLVAPGGERAHQQQVAGLPHRRRRHQLSGGAFGGGQLGSAQLQAGGGVALQGADAGVGQPAAPPVDPAVRRVRQQRPAGDELRGQRRVPGPPPVAGGHGRLRGVQRSQRLLDVDPGRFSQYDRQLPTTLDHARPDDGAQPGDHHGQRGVGRGRRDLVPQRVDQRLTGDRLRSAQGEIAEQHAGLTAQSVGAYAAAVHLHAKGPHNWTRAPSATSGIGLTSALDRNDTPG